MRHLPRTVLYVIAGLLSLMACGGSDATGPSSSPEQIELTAAQIQSLDSTGRVIEQANPTDAILKSLVDSTLLVLTSGVVAKRIDVSTDLTADALFFVVIHRVYERTTGGGFATWNLVGMNDPSRLTSVVEVSGFAESATGIPSGVTGTMGDASGAVNALLLSVASGGAVSEWFGSSGAVSFASGSAGAACPSFPATAHVTCTLETVRVHFTTNGSGMSGSRRANLAMDVDVPGLRLTYRS